MTRVRFYIALVDYLQQRPNQPDCGDIQLQQTDNIGTKLYHWNKVSILEQSYNIVLFQLLHELCLRKFV